MKNRLLTTFVMAMLATICTLAQKVTIDGITYKVKGNCAVVSSSDKKIVNAIIKSFVEIEGKEYPVTEIKNGVFAERMQLRKVSIPNSIHKVGENAFAACRSLTELIIPDNQITYALNRVSWSPFSQCYLITTVRCQDGSIPTYILGLLWDCPFKEALQSSVASQLLDIKETQNPSQQQPTQIEEETKAPSSDIDQNIPEATDENENENTFALILTCETYQEEKKVEYALNDGETFKMYCQKTLGMPEENIHLRQDATLNNIKTEMEWMRKIAEAYNGTARFIIYFNGHSILDNASDASFLLPIDGKNSLPETGYSLQELCQLLGSLPATSISVFLDTNIRSASISPLDKTMIFMAADATETAYPFNEKEHSLFTYYLLKKLQTTKGDVTMEDLCTYVTEQVSRKSVVTHGQSQTPKISISDAMGNDWKTIKLK